MQFSLLYDGQGLMMIELTEKAKFVFIKNNKALKY